MNFEALPSNCFNIGKKVKMKVTSAVPLCLLAGMAIVTCGCTAMKLSSEDSTARAEAIKAYTDPVDQVYIACLDYPDDVRLEAFKALVKGKNQAYVDMVARVVLDPTKWQPENALQENEKQRASYTLRLRAQWTDPVSIDSTGDNFRNAVYENISQGALVDVLTTSGLVANEARRSILKDLLNTSPHTVGVLSALKNDKRWNYERQMLCMKLLKGEKVKTISDTELLACLDSWDYLALYEETKDVDLLHRLAECSEARKLDTANCISLYEKSKDVELLRTFVERSGDNVELMYKAADVAPELIPLVCKLVYEIWREPDWERYDNKCRNNAAQKLTEWGKVLTQKDPTNELLLKLLIAGRLDKEDMTRVLEKTAWPDVKKLMETVRPRNVSTIDLLNACPEFAQKANPKEVVALLKDEHVCDAEKYTNLPLPIAQAFVDDGTRRHTSIFGPEPCPMSDTILMSLPIISVYEVLTKKRESYPTYFFNTMRQVVDACALNDANVESLLKMDLAPSAMGLRRLQAALKADTVSAEWKTKIQAYIEKVRAEAVANEAKAKEVRLVIDHCYVGMREIDHIVLPPQKGVMYGEKNGIITSFGWTAKQCYDWFEIENDRFQWEFAKKFGLSSFKFDMSVKAESQTSFNPELLLFDAMSGADTAVVSVPKISVQQWWLSTTRERGKNVEFLYNEEDKNNTLIMREIQ